MYIVLQGVLAPADSGVLERVAQTRYVYFQQLPQYRRYDTLVAVADCRHLGKSGWLISKAGIKKALVVDCENSNHKGQMNQRGIVADTNGPGGKGWLILR